MQHKTNSGLSLCAGFIVACGTVWIAGCDGMQPTPPEESKLAGDWETTDENGRSAGIRFDEEGQLQGIVTQNDSDDVVIIVVNESTTTVDGDDVTIEIATGTGSAVFAGVLSADESTIEGSLTRAIEVSDEITVVIPEGDVILARVTDPSCFLVTCNEGESCVDGQCVAQDPCESIVCTNGEVCVEGQCEPVDLCEGVVCTNGEICADGQCLVQDPCESIVCTNGEECVDGECVLQDPCDNVICTNGEVCFDGVCEPDEGAVADPAAGQAFYEANGCAGCHGTNASGGAGTSLIGVDPTTLLENLNGTDTHPTMVEAVSETDAENLAAFVASLP